MLTVSEIEHAILLSVIDHEIQYKKIPVGVVMQADTWKSYCRAVYVGKSWEDVMWKVQNVNVYLSPKIPYGEMHLYSGKKQNSKCVLDGLTHYTQADTRKFHFI